MGLNLKKWSIWLAERAVTVRVEQHLAEYGKPFSHPFLALTTPENEVAAEIHGTWPKKGMKYPFGYLLDQFTGAVQHKTLNSVLATVGKPVYPKAVIVVVDGQRQFNRAIEKQELLSGSEEEMSKVWKAVQTSFPDLNAKKLPFYRYATPDSGFANCQVLLRTALEKTGVVDDIPDLKLAQTGWTEKAKAAITLSL